MLIAEAPRSGPAAEPVADSLPRAAASVAGLELVVPAAVRIAAGQAVRIAVDPGRSVLRELAVGAERAAVGSLPLVVAPSA
jgi:hypothetical protein